MFGDDTFNDSNCNISIISLLLSNILTVLLFKTIDVLELINLLAVLVKKKNNKKLIILLMSNLMTIFIKPNNCFLFLN